MSVLDVVCIGVASLFFVISCVCGIQLYRWERLLKGVRVQVHYKGKTAMTPRLLDWFLWAKKLEGDKQVNGQVVYQLGGTRITLRKPLPRSHGKTKRRTIKGDPHA